MQSNDAKGEMPKKRITNQNDVMWNNPQAYRDEGYNAALADCEPIVAKMKAEIAELRSQLNQKPSRERVIEVLKQELGCHDHRGGMWDCDLQIVDKSFPVIHQHHLEQIADAILKLLRGEHS